MFFVISSLLCGEYFIGYEIYFKNGSPLDWRYFVSPAMVHSKKRKKLFCKIKFSKKYSQKEFFIRKREEILECLFRHKGYFYSFEEMENSFFSSVGVLKAPFVKVEVEFKKNYVFMWEVD